MNKPRLKVSQYTNGTQRPEYTIYRVFNINQKWFNGFSVNSTTFKKNKTIEQHLDWLNSIGCQFTANKTINILKG